MLQINGQSIINVCIKLSDCRWHPWRNFEPIKQVSEIQYGNDRCRGEI